MSREWTTKSFKSGNSVALRVPASVGIAPGKSWRLVEDGEDYRLEKIAKPKAKFDIDKVWGIGKHLNLKLIADRDREFEPRPSSRENPEWEARLQKKEP